MSVANQIAGWRNSILLIKGIQRPVQSLAIELGLEKACDALEEVLSNYVSPRRFVEISNAWFAEKENLKKHIAVLEESLRWYADVAPKQIDVYGAGMNSLPKYEWDKDEGKRARQALKED